MAWEQGCQSLLNCVVSQLANQLLMADGCIMAYGSTPYVGMAPKKMAATVKVHKWHAQNVCVRLVNGLHEPYHTPRF